MATETATKLTRSFRLTDSDRERAKKDRTLDLSFSSEHPVRRYDWSEGEEYDEVLSHDDDDMDLRSLQNRGPLCDMHDLNRQIGVIESASIGQATVGTYKGKVGRAVVRFSKSPEAEKVYQDVIDDIRSHISVGYEITGMISSMAGENGVQVRRFRWRPYEISSVSAPEDPNVGFGRGKSDVEKPPKSMPDPVATPTDPKVVVEIENRARDEIRARVKKIHATTTQLCKDFPAGAEQFRVMCAEAVEKDESVEDFNARALKAIPGIKVAKTVNSDSVMDRREQAEYSLVRGIQSTLRRSQSIGSITRIPDGLEGEVHERMCKLCPDLAAQAQGFLVPHDRMVSVPIQRGRMGRRDLNVTTFSQGGAFVPTTLLTPIIEILRNQMVCLRMGVQSMAGLSGNVVIPRQTGAATAYALPETAALTQSTQSLDQINFVPHRVGATNTYSKLLLLQSSADVENFVRDDLLQVLAIKWDALMLLGQGAASEITGILNTPGIATVTFGTTATWAKVISFETALAVGNALRGVCGYVTSPTVRGVWKGLPKAGTTNQFPIFIWEPLNDDEFNDGMVNGYRAAATNQVPANLVFYGRWSEGIQGIWGGYDVVVNPYSLDTNAQVRVTVNTFGDFAVRHAASFAVSTDSGAQ